jgi:hypothetical protein
LGCRIKSAIDGCHLMLGLPGSMLAPVHKNIITIEKPNNMPKKARPIN